MTPDQYIPALEASLKDYRVADVRLLTRKINPITFKVGDAKKVINLLRRKRYFEDMDFAANAFIQAGIDAPMFHRQRAQALIDQNLVTQALHILEPLAKEVSNHPLEGPEVRGLIGRAYKQLYANEGGEDNLHKSISAYLPDWSSNRVSCRWHGINIVALMCRAKRDGITINKNLDYKDIAQTILDDIEDGANSDAWDFATGMEAAIALGEWNAAIDWAGKYVKHPSTDAFECASTLRQLREIWQLEGSAEGDRLLPVLEYALSQQEGATFEPLHSKLHDASGFEAVYGSEGIVLMQWLDTLHQRCLAIARIIDSATGQPFGTGFLMKGSSLWPAWGDASVLVTNAHVCSIDPKDQAPLRPETATAEFTRVPNRPKVSLGELLYSSPRTELDVSILRIQPPSDSNFLEPLSYPPAQPRPEDRPQRIYVVGHAGGNELAVSMYDNDLASYAPPYVRYRSPTETGNSGSPVFNRQWGLFAVHHRALHDEQVNEGILFNAISSVSKA